MNPLWKSETARCKTARLHGQQVRIPGLETLLDKARLCMKEGDAERVQREIAELRSKYRQKRQARSQA